MSASMSITSKEGEHALNVRVDHFLNPTLQVSPNNFLLLGQLEDRRGTVDTGRFLGNQRA